MQLITFFYWYLNYKSYVFIFAIVSLKTNFSYYTFNRTVNSTKKGEKKERNSYKYGLGS